MTGQSRCVSALYYTTLCYMVMTAVGLCAAYNKHGDVTVVELGV